MAFWVSGTVLHTSGLIWAESAHWSCQVFKIEFLSQYLFKIHGRKCVWKLRMCTFKFCQKILSFLISLWFLLQLRKDWGNFGVLTDLHPQSFLNCCRNQREMRKDKIFWQNRKVRILSVQTHFLACILTAWLMRTINVKVWWSKTCFPISEHLFTHIST